MTKTELRTIFDNIKKELRLERNGIKNLKGWTLSFDCWDEIAYTSNRYRAIFINPETLLLSDCKDILLHEIAHAFIYNLFNRNNGYVPYDTDNKNATGYTLDAEWNGYHFDIWYQFYKELGGVGDDQYAYNFKYYNVEENTSNLMYCNKASTFVQTNRI